MKLFKQLSLFALLGITALSTVQTLDAQCTISGAPVSHGTFNATNGASQTFSNIPTGRVVTVTVPVANTTVNVSMCGTNPGTNVPSGTNDSYLTVYNSTNLTTAVTTIDDGCTNMASPGYGPGVGSFVATTVGTYYIYVTEYDAAGTDPCIADGVNSAYIMALSASSGAPANDNCSGATSLTMGTSCTATNGTNTGATESMPAALCSGYTSSVANDVWYSFVATSSSATIDVQGGAGFDGVVELFSGSCTSLTSVTCTDNTGSAGLETIAQSGLTVGSTYRVRVYGYGTSTGSFTICVYGTPPAPANNECTGAISLTAGTTCNSIAGTSTNATESLPGCTGNANDDVWYSFVANSTTMAVDVLGDIGYDPVIELFSGSCVSATSLSCMDANGDGGLESITATSLTIGSTYYVRVYDYYATNPTVGFSICAYSTVAPPSNDEPCTATTLTVATNTCTPTIYNNNGATVSADVCFGSKDVWFQFTVPASGIFTIRNSNGTLSAADAVIGIYSGTSCSALTNEGCYIMDGSPLSFSSFPSTTAWISVSSQTGLNGDFGLCVNTYTPLAAPTLITPANAATNVSTNTSFSWSSVAGAGDYLLVYDTDPNFGAPTVVSVTGTSQVENLAASTTYYWSVRANDVNANPGTFASVWSFTTGAAAAPTVTISATPSTICVGSPVTATATATGVTGSYAWFVNGLPTGITTSSYTGTPPSAGTYTISCTVTPTTGAPVTGTTTVTVNPQPTVNISSTATTICAGASTTLTGTGATSYVWSNGATTASITVSPTSNTVYSVTGTANGCNAAASQTITVNPVPVVTVSGAGSICAGQNVTLTASGATSYAWSNGATTASITVTPSATTTYTVTGTSAGCASAAVTKTVTVTPLPVVTISGGNAVCPGQSVTLTASGATSYAWSNGATTASITVTPSATTTYTVTGTSGSCTSAAVSQTVTVTSNLSVTIAGPTSVCAGQSVTLTASGASTYTWSNGATTASITVSPTSNTTYTVTGASGSCSANPVSQTVTVTPNPVVTISGANTVCAGQSVTLTASGATSYTWSNGATTPSITVTPTTTTIYTVTGTNGACSSAPATQTVTVTPAPVVSISGTNAICAGQSVTLTASGATSYAWSNGATTPSITVTPTTTTVYTVTGTTGACTSTPATQTVTVTPLPVVSISGPTTVCAGQSVTLTASGATTYTWSNGASGASITVTPTATTTYTVLGASGTCTSIPVSQTVTVNPIPVVSISGANTVCAGQSVTLTASGATTYAWSNGATTASITVSPTSTMTYTVTGTSNSCTSAPASQTVTVNPAPMVTISGSSTICAGESVTLTASGATSYAWSNGLTTASITVIPVATTTYTVTGSTATTACTGTANHIVTVNPLPTTPVITATTTTLSSSAASGNQWYLNGVLIPAATGMTYTPTQSGNYSVIVTDANGCSSSVSNTINFTVVGLEDAFANGISVYPNPSNGIFTVEGMDMNQDYEISVVNALGQVVLEAKNIATHTLNQPGGMYWVKVSQGNNTATYKLIVE